MMAVMYLKSSLRGDSSCSCDKQRRLHLKGADKDNGETTLVAQADGPNLLTTLCTYLHRGVVAMKSSMLGATAVAAVTYVRRGAV